MAHLTLVTPETQKPSQSSSKRRDHKEKRQSNPKPKPKQKPEVRTKSSSSSSSLSLSSSSSSSSSWDQIKNLLTCKQIEASQVHDPSRKSDSKIGSSCGSLCSVRDVVHGNTRVVHRADNSPETSSVGQDSAGLVSRKPVTRSSARSNSLASNNSNHHGYTSSSSKGMQFRKLSGCYECHMIVDPSRYPIQPRSTICSCPQCGEVFPKIESLELHQAIRHAVSELGPEDSGRNIVEIIFKSSWLKKDSPIFTIERILKVHNTQRTIQRFEDCRDAVKSRAARKNPRCAADGNELLRFHCTTLSCSLGSRGSSSLCSSAATSSSSAAASSSCGVCAAIRHGFSASEGGGVVTTASSGRAHDSLAADRGGYFSRRAMIVCRVIAGKVKRDGGDSAEGYDSVAGSSSGIAYNNLEELTVFNPKAILPCFVVIYKAVGSQ